MNRPFVIVVGDMVARHHFKKYIECLKQHFRVTEVATVSAMKNELDGVDPRGVVFLSIFNIEEQFKRLHLDPKSISIKILIRQTSIFSSNNADYALLDLIISHSQQQKQLLAKLGIK
jgi:hypothetical protein